MFNGSGTFSLVAGNPVVSGTVISSTWANNTLSDIATGLSTCITKDGQQTVTANIPMSSFKLTGLGVATVTGDALSYGQAATVTTLTATGTSTLAGITGTGTLNFTGGTATATTQALGDSSTLLATTAFVAGTAFASALPAQTGNSGRIVTTDGTTASWVGRAPYSARTSNTILANADSGSFIDITSGTFSQTFTAAATLLNGWSCVIRNSGTGDITLDPNGSETIDGLTTYIMYPGEARLVTCNGTGFFTAVLQGFSRTFTSSGTFTRPPGYHDFDVYGWGAGGGGGGGQGLAAGNIRLGGAGGGGGAKVYKRLAYASVSSSTTVTIGAAGTGGNGGSAGNGSNGTAGGNTTFGTLLTAFGGGYGIGGQASDICGGGGGGPLSAGTNGTTSASNAKTYPDVTTGGTGSNAGLGGAGATNAAAGVAFGCAENGGAAGGGNAVGGNNPTTGGSSIYGGCGGGAGGSMTAANAATNASAGGVLGSYLTGGGGAGGTGSGGAAGTSGASTGAGGGGGAANTAGTGGAAGAGGARGDGGGGGGAGTTTGGRGGDGFRGECIVMGVL